MLIITLIIFCNCSHKNDRVKIVELLNSTYVGDNIKAYYLIGESRDTSFIRELVKDPYDSRVTNNLEFKGISVYQAKMIALRKLTGVPPPKIITYEPDSLIGEFYINLLRERKLIK
ncbi:hypothetical protein Solca_2472 [Solitalea canadensis DSM 3403]|uniref:Uncharacterized protein n=2 Tax=Solitalea canadensis TaxID=995 RepID=H8KRI6_SOLCM|nr:hypothetical protein Solca_2472 [Solitalea canadensis DSM 3403]